LGITSWGVTKLKSDKLDECKKTKGSCLMQSQTGLVGVWVQEKTEEVDCSKFNKADFCKAKTSDAPLIHCNAKCDKSELTVTMKSQIRDIFFGYTDGDHSGLVKKEGLVVNDYTIKCWRQGPAIGLIVAGLSCMVFVGALAFLAAQYNETLIYIAAIVFAIVGMIAAVLGVSFAIAANNPLTSCKFNDKDLDKAVKSAWKENHKAYVGGAGAVGLVGAILSIFVVLLAIVAIAIRPAPGPKGLTTTIHPGP